MNPLKQAREALGLRVKDVAGQTGIDQALICKFESGERIPTPKQADALAILLRIEPENLQVYRLSRKILGLTADRDIALKALRVAEAELSGVERKDEVPVDEILKEMDVLRAMLLKKKTGQ